MSQVCPSHSLSNIVYMFSQKMIVDYEVVRDFPHYSCSLENTFKLSVTQLQSSYLVGRCTYFMIGYKILVDFETFSFILSLKRIFNPFRYGLSHQRLGPPRYINFLNGFCKFCFYRGLDMYIKG